MAGRPHALVTQGDVAIDTVVEGDGPAIVILPSLGRDGLEDYDATAAALVARGWRVLRPQPRGIGRSVGPMAGVLLPELADDIALVVRRLGGGSAVLVGHAYGNWVARMTAVAHPEHVRGVVLAAAAANENCLRFSMGCLRMAMDRRAWRCLRPPRGRPVRGWATR